MEKKFAGSSLYQIGSMALEKKNDRLHWNKIKFQLIREIAKKGIWLLFISISYIFHLKFPTCSGRELFIFWCVARRIFFFTDYPENTFIKTIRNCKRLS